MKQVIIQTTPTIPTINISNINENDHYALLTENNYRMPLIMQKTEFDNSYIFKSLTNDSGHSGYSNTKKRAITYAISCLPKTIVYQFETLEELFKWCLDIKN